MAKISASKGKAQILSEKDIENILSRVSDSFAEDLNRELILDVNNFKQEIMTIINKMKFIEVYSSNSGKYKGSRISRMGKQKRAYLAEGYLLIFKMRQFLLNEPINYRYYYNTDNGGARVISFSEDNLLKYMKFGQFSIQILDSALKKQESDQSYQQLLDIHYANLMNGLQKANTTGFYVVHSAIMNKYGGLNPGLRRKNANNYQVFTRGHIFEAMDIAFSEAMQEQKIADYGLIEKAMFGKYLAYDNIAASKGGDNAITMTSIKANVADILDYTTIIKNLQSILNILELRDRAEMKTAIESLFMDQSKYQTLNDFNDAANAAVDKLLDVLIT